MYPRFILRGQVGHHTVRDKRINWGVPGYREILTHLIVFYYLQLTYIIIRLFLLKIYYFDCDAYVNV